MPSSSFNTGTSNITATPRNGVLHIGINRPEKRNAFTIQMSAGLAAAYQHLADSDDLRVGLVYAEGEHFSAGLDLADVGPAVASGKRIVPEGRIDPFGIWGPACPKPIVTAIQGSAFTLSIELALASDIVIAADSVVFAQLEVARGIVPFGGATVRAVRNLGWGNAMRFMLTAEPFGAEDAHRIGLVQEIVTSDQLHDRATEIAEMIATRAPLGIAAILRQSRLSLDVSFDAAVEDIERSLIPIMTSNDAAEGLASFIERREGKFTGS